MSVINTNVTSVIAQKNLTSSKSSLTTAMERLSSGLRINSAKDDAAGQAVANRMTAQVKGLAQAQRNANDGISVAQTAEGALNQINDNLQRVRELAVQAQNGTNSEDDLGSIQNEIGQRLNEINRISEETSFNGVKVLAKDQELSIQVGAEDGQTIKINLGKINAESLNLANFNVDGKAEVANTAASKDDLILAGFVKGTGNDYTKTTTTANTAATSADLFGKLADGDTVSYAGTDTGLNLAATGGTYAYDEASGNFTFDVAAAAKADAISYITPNTGEKTAATITIDGSAQNVVIDSNGDIWAEDGETTLYLDTTGNLTQNGSGTLAQATVSDLADSMGLGGNGTGGTIKIGDTTFTSDGTAETFDVVGATIGASQLNNVADGAAYSVTLDGTQYDVAAGGAVTDNAGGDPQFVNGSGALTTDTETVETTTYYAQDSGMVTNATGAQVFKNADDELTFDATTAGTKTEDPLATLDDALKMVDSLRSDLGAIQNRFESAITNLSTNETNITAARSRIQDADYAVEVGNMTRAQILQQAGTSVLAQANQLPQGVLSLLR